MSTSGVALVEHAGRAGRREHQHVLDPLLGTGLDQERERQAPPASGGDGRARVVRRVGRRGVAEVEVLASHRGEPTGVAGAARVVGRPDAPVRCEQVGR